MPRHDANRGIPSFDISARPRPAVPTERTGGAVDGRRIGIHMAGLDRAPDALNDPLGSVDVLRIRRHRMQRQLRLLRLGQHRELEMYRLGGPTLNKFVVEQELAAGVCDMLLAPVAACSLEVADFQGSVGL